MLFTGGHPPGPHAGDISPLTKALRPPIAMPAEECQKARRLRRAGLDLDEIAARLAVSGNEVRQALATMRKRAATRQSLNVTLAAHQFVKNEANAAECCWETVDRLLGELALRRALGGAPITRSTPP